MVDESPLSGSFVGFCTLGWSPRATARALGESNTGRLFLSIGGEQNLVAFERQGPPQQQGPRINEQIRISPLRVIDAEGKMLGVISRDEALNVAREQGLDLVEVASQERPPVCRIMDFGKFKYEQNKKKTKTKQHHQQLKEIRVSPGVGDHDLDFKLKHAREFLAQKDKVLITVQFRHRQLAHMELGNALCRKIATMLADVAKVERMPMKEGKKITALLAPK